MSDPTPPVDPRLTPKQLVERACRFNCDAESSCSCWAHQLYRAAALAVAPSAPDAALRALVEKWRRDSRRILYSDNAFLECADQLDAALAVRPPVAAPPDTRSCTCHPDDNPPVPCAKKYALSECLSSVPASPPTREGWQPPNGYAKVEAVVHQMRAWATAMEAQRTNTTAEKIRAWAGELDDLLLDYALRHEVVCVDDDIPPAPAVSPAPQEDK